MTKLTLEIPDSLHRTVKSFASANGETIKKFFVEAATEKLKKSMKLKIKPLRKSHKKDSKYISEKEADRMLRPYLIKLVQRIESGEEETFSWEEVKKELQKS